MSCIHIQCPLCSILFFQALHFKFIAAEFNRLGHQRETEFILLLLELSGLAVGEKTKLNYKGGKKTKKPQTSTPE